MLIFSHSARISCTRKSFYQCAQILPRLRSALLSRLISMYPAGAILHERFEWLFSRVTAAKKVICLHSLWSMRWLRLPSKVFFFFIIWGWSDWSMRRILVEVFGTGDAQHRRMVIYDILLFVLGNGWREEWNGVGKMQEKKSGGD